MRFKSEGTRSVGPTVTLEVAVTGVWRVQGDTSPVEGRGLTGVTGVCGARSRGSGGGDDLLVSTVGSVSVPPFVFLVDPGLSLFRPRRPLPPSVQSIGSGSPDP